MTTDRRQWQDRRAAQAIGRQLADLVRERREQQQRTTVEAPASAPVDDGDGEDTAA